MNDPRKRPKNQDRVEFWSSQSGDSLTTQAEDDAAQLASEVIRLRAELDKEIEESAKISVELFVLRSMISP